MKLIDSFLSKITTAMIIIISPVPFRASSIFHWGFVVGVPSEPDECWGINADRELAGRYLESPKMPKKSENRDLFLCFPKEENSLKVFIS